MPVSAIAVGTTLRFKFLVPKAPLVLETTLLRAVTQYGFTAIDDTGAIALTNGTVVGGTDVQFTLARPVEANARGRLGLDNLGTGMTLTGGASHNLRDSTTDTVLVAGNRRPLCHVAPHFELPISSLVE